MTTTSVSYSSSSSETKSTYFWIVICELALRGYLSFFILTAEEYNVEEMIEDYKQQGERIPGAIMLSHMIRNFEKYASIIVSGLGIILAKKVMDSECWMKEDSKNKEKGK